jgi:hypothetical protein
VIIVPDLATTARVRGDWRWERYPFIDRGSYEVAHAIDEPELADVAVRAASRAMGRELTFREARALRLSPGDYLLAHHDRVYEDFPVEVVFDLSPREVPGAAVHYRRRGNVFFVFPSRPGAASIIERGPTVTCNHTYVSKRQDGVVTRVVMLLA